MRFKIGYTHHHHRLKLRSRVFFGRKRGFRIENASKITYPLNADFLQVLCGLCVFSTPLARRPRGGQVRLKGWRQQFGELTQGRSARQPAAAETDRGQANAATVRGGGTVHYPTKQSRKVRLAATPTTRKQLTGLGQRHTVIAKGVDLDHVFRLVRGCMESRINYSH